MIIDAPGKELRPGLRRLWQEAFGDTDVFLDGFFATGFSPDRCCCVLEEGHLAAALYWFDCNLQDRKLAYIYAVATAASFRGKGLCRQLMEHTHRHLQRQGYEGAVLVPGDQGLFRLYEKLGYRSFCPMTHTRIPAGTPIPLRPLTGGAYTAERRQYLPGGGIVQEGATVEFLSTFTAFYALDGGILCAAKEDKTLYVQEYLGDSSGLPGAIAALGCDTGHVYLPGKGTDRAMYLPLSPTAPQPTYLGLALN